MDARIVIVCCLFIAVCASSHRPSAWAPQSDSQEHSSDGVCYYTQLEFTYQWVNQSYPCCKQKVRPHCGESRFRRWSDFHLPNFGPSCGCSFLPADTCVYVVATTCYKYVRECRARPVRKEYCCNGYTRNGRGKCVEDVDGFVECGTDNGGCEQICRCRNRRPVCSCLPGFTLDGTRRCRDVNECTVKKGNCQHDCHNTNGSYYCSCRPGFVLTTRYNCTEMAVSTPAVIPTVIPTTTTEFREPLATSGTGTDEVSPGAGVGPAERMFVDDNDGEEGGHAGSRVAAIVGPLAGLLGLILLALLVFALVRYGYCCCCCCCAAAAASDEKKKEPGQAYDNEIYEDLASCVSARKEKPATYDNVVVADTQEKKPIDDQVYDNRLNHDLYACGVASANPAVYDNAAVVDDNAAGTNQAGDNDAASQVNVYVDMM